MTTLHEHEFRGLICRRPALRWEDALPSGNGIVGAMVFGHIVDDVILINHDDLWLRTPPADVPDISGRLGELRQLLAAGRYDEAQEFINRSFEEAGGDENRIDPYHPAFCLRVRQDAGGAPSGYRRVLDFRSGESTVRWESPAGRFRRRTFVSRTDDVVVLAMDAPAGSEGVAGHLELQPFGPGVDDRVARELETSGLTYETSAEDGWLRITGRYPGGDAFGGLARVTHDGGCIDLYENRLIVRGAQRVLVVLRLFAHEAADPAFDRLRRQLAALPTEYDPLLASHAAEHAALFDRCRLTLRAAAGGQLPPDNEDLLDAAADGDLPAELAERMFDFGRYLLISSSTSGGWPANLQGIWNGRYDPPWASDIHINENLQMNYWPALPTGLAETTLPFFEYVEQRMDDYRHNAARVYGCRGILMPHAHSTHGRTTGRFWVAWTVGAGWLGQLFYDYWLFTGDESFLRDRVVPYLREVALFFEDFLIAGPDGRLVFSPSNSPENRPDCPHASLVTINATMDVAVLKEVLTNLIAACEQLGTEAEAVPRWREMLDRLPAYEINDDGAIREWLWPGLKDNYHHRHQSHIYPLFPGFEVTREQTPELFEAMRVAVEKRLVVGLRSQTGWSFAHMANIYARLGQADRALECLHNIARACTGDNLLTYHNDWRAMGLSLFWGHGRSNNIPFQIDANFGYAAAVVEMLLQSRPKQIKLLPALPDAWAVGCAEGLRTRTRVDVDLRWDRPAGRVEATLTSAIDQSVEVGLPEGYDLADPRPPVEITPSPHAETLVAVRLPAGQPIRLVLARTEK